MYTIGIDPGLTETGVVLLGDGGYYLAGVTFRAPKEGPDLQRIVNLADTIVGTVKSMVYDNHIRELLIGIEYPVANRGPWNVETYRKQAALLHEIEAELWRWQNTLPEVLPRVRIAEVNPTASKRVATGDGKASKDDMIHASPFERRDDIRRPSREALADAWAHALAARLVAGVDRVIELEGLAREILAPAFVDTRVLKLEVNK